MSELTLQEIIDRGEYRCDCGKIHKPGVAKVIIEKGAVNALPGLLKEIGAAKPFILSGHETDIAAGDLVRKVLENNGIDYRSYAFEKSPVKPTEFTVGSALMHYDFSCDAIIGVGSGVINDTGKMLARATGKKYIIVATAPSMDGFVSATSSMDRDGLKVSLNSTAAWAVVGDLDVLCNAPMHLLRAGVGDMLAKIISLREWSIAKITAGEYFCPEIYEMVESSLNRVVANAQKLLERDPEAVKAVMEGLIIAGMGMNFAGVSRPASGGEHYFSHIWDMRGLAFEDAQVEQHGIQTGIGCYYSLLVYKYILDNNITPDHGKAMSFVESFDLDAWHEKLKEFVGPGAEAMIAGDKKERQYDVEKHAARLKIIEDNWTEIVEIIKTFPTPEEIKQLMDSIGFPTSAECIGYNTDMVRTTFTMTKDIRDKYVCSKLLWDLGILDEVAGAVFVD